MKKRKSLDYLLIVLMLIGVFTLIFSRILAKPVSNLDELWNYNTARQIMNGLIPYKDISMITTPLLPTIVAIILKLTTDELIIFRIITAIVSTAIIYMTYLIIKLLLKSKLTSFILTGAIAFIYYKNFMLDYNFVILLITLIIEYLELKKLENIINQKIITEENKQDKIIINIEKNNKFNLLIGILAGLAICTKQTAGAFIALGTLLVQLLFINNRENFKQYMKNALVRIIGMMIPCIIFLGFLIVSGSLKYFIDYALLGIKTFSNSIPYLGIIKGKNIIIKNLAIILPIMLFGILDILIINSIPKQKRISIKILSRLEIMTVYSIVILIVLYPISDNVHFLVAMLPLLIESIYVLMEALIKLYNKIKFKIVKYIVLACKIAIIICIISVGTVYTYKELDKYVSNENKTNNVEHYKNIIVAQGIKDRINDINNLINKMNEKGINVIILDAEAAVIDIPLNRYYKNYDMFLKGNIGKDGEQGIINDIQNSSKCIYLIKKEKKNLNWQTPKDVINYVEENLEKIGQVSIYNAYYKQ